MLPSRACEQLSQNSESSISGASKTILDEPPYLLDHGCMTTAGVPSGYHSKKNTVLKASESRRAPQKGTNKALNLIREAIFAKVSYYGGLF